MNIKVLSEKTGFSVKDAAAKVKELGMANADFDDLSDADILELFAMTSKQKGEVLRDGIKASLEGTENFSEYADYEEYKAAKQQAKKDGILIGDRALLIEGKFCMKLLSWAVQKWDAQSKDGRNYFSQSALVTLLATDGVTFVDLNGKPTKTPHRFSPTFTDTFETAVENAGLTDIGSIWPVEVGQTDPTKDKQSRTFNTYELAVD